MKQMKTAYAIATTLIAAPHRPSDHTAAFGHSEPRNLARYPRTTGIVYATYRATVLKDVTIGTAPLHTMATKPAATIVQIAAAGAPCFALTPRITPANG